MSQTSLTVLSHWSTLVENMHASPQEFYTHVSDLVKMREIPDIKIERVTWKEGGFLSADRVYLRVSRGRYLYDICAAPFGTGFFFSSWMAVKMPSPLWAIIGLIALPFVAIWAFVFLVFLAGTTGFMLWGAGCVTCAVLFFIFLSKEESTFADYVFVVPRVGPYLEKVFRPNTYFRMDTESMFSTMAHKAVLEAVDATTKEKGAREVIGDERKPILRGFFDR